MICDHGSFDLQMNRFDFIYVGKSHQLVAIETSLEDTLFLVLSISVMHPQALAIAIDLVIRTKVISIGLGMAFSRPKSVQMWRTETI